MILHILVVGSIFERMFFFVELLAMLSYSDQESSGQKSVSPQIMIKYKVLIDQRMTI